MGEIWFRPWVLLLSSSCMNKDGKRQSGHGGGMDPRIKANAIHEYEEDIFKILLHSESSPRFLGDCLEASCLVFTPSVPWLGTHTKLEPIRFLPRNLHLKRLNLSLVLGDTECEAQKLKCLCVLKKINPVSWTRLRAVPQYGILSATGWTLPQAPPLWLEVRACVWLSGGGEVTGLWWIDIGPFVGGGGLLDLCSSLHYWLC